jgi:hypothetical protein
MKQLFFKTTSIALVSLVVALGFGGVRKAVSATTDDQVTVSPVRVSRTHLTTGNNRTGEESRAVADSLESLGVEVENTSDKDIRYVAVKLDFPGIVFHGARLSLPITFGHLTLTGQAARTMATVAPRGIIHLSLSKSLLDQARKGIAQAGYRLPSVDQLTIRTSLVVFADGTAWSNGTLFNPDPGDPMQWNAAGSTAPALGNTMSLSKVSYVAPSAPTAAQTCYHVTGFRVIFCCVDCSGNWIEAATYHFGLGGTVQPQTNTATCDCGDSCEVVEPVGCS